MPPAACHTSTCARMAKINHVWPTAFPSRSVMPDLCSDEATRVPLDACHIPACARMAKINHIWPTACPSRSVIPGLGLESSQSAYSYLPHTNMCHNGGNQSCLAHSVQKQVSYDWTGLGRLPECLQLPATQQHAPDKLKSIMVGPQRYSG